MAFAANDRGPVTPDRPQAIRSYHDELLGLTPRTAEFHHAICGWNSAESQEARFAALLRASSFRGGSVVDFGCGSGDLFDYLSKTPYRFTYVGVDLNPNMLAVAQTTYPATFRRIEPDSTRFPGADYVFASGVFQFLDADEPDYYRRLLPALFEKARVALAVNFLSSARPDPDHDDGQLRLDPAGVAGIAASMTSSWLLDHSYHPGDMTLCLRTASRPDPLAAGGVTG
jgi:SAM-dependent methyltransferase